MGAAHCAAPTTKMLLLLWSFCASDWTLKIDVCKKLQGQTEGKTKKKTKQEKKENSVHISEYYLPHGCHRRITLYEMTHILTVRHEFPR